MKNICKVILLGRCANGMKMEYTQGNRAVANFSVATNRSWKDKQSGEWVEAVEYSNCVMWGDDAAALEGTIHKGTHLKVRGRLETRKWQDKDGRDRYATEVICDSVGIIPGVAKSRDASPAAPKREFTPPPAPADDDDDSLPF